MSDKERSMSPKKEETRGRSPRRDRQSERPTSPPPSRVLGVFGLSKRTDEAKLKAVFGKYGEIEKAIIVYDLYTKESRGFGFVTFCDQDGATQARLELNNMSIDERNIRVDFSVTKQAHSSTPGEYMGTTHPRIARERDEERRRQCDRPARRERSSERRYERDDRDMRDRRDERDSRDRRDRRDSPLRRDRRDSPPRRDRRDSPARRDRRDSPRRESRDRR